MVFFLVLIFVFVFLLFVYMLREAFLNQVIHQTFTFPNFPSGFNEMRIFFISDIHRRNIQESIINEVVNNAEFVVIGGDLLEKGVPFNRVEHNLKLLQKIGPLFFVWGNNDYEVEEERLVKLFKKYNVLMLRNCSTVFRASNGDTIALMGIDDISQENDRLDLVLENTKSANFKILISHNPKIVMKMSELDNISLVISGHTHGGQIHLFGYSPDKKGGVYKMQFTTQLISNGYGTSMLPLRLGAKPETHLITLRKG
jgi:uncharacterized protein